MGFIRLIFASVFTEIYVRKLSKVTIISLDASLPVLYQNGIKPDICVSMERDEPTSAFFKKVPKTFQQGIVFVCVSLQHKTVFEAIRAGTLVVPMRPFKYNYFFKLDEFGYTCAGMSSANMAHELAYQMGYTKCVLIGQDLAYGKDGMSHTKGHIFGEDEVQNGFNKVTQKEEELLELDAYGGEGKVKSSIFWKLFLRGIEKTIVETNWSMETIDATEGGARKEGATEMPFREVVEKYIASLPKKKRIILKKPSEDEAFKYLKDTSKILKNFISESKKLKKEVEKTFLAIEKKMKKTEGKSEEELIAMFSTDETVKLLDTVNKARDFLGQNEVIK